MVRIILRDIKKINVYNLTLWSRTARHDYMSAVS